MDDEHEYLQKEKLKFEIVELKRPIYSRPAFWFGLLGVLLALVGVLGQSYLSSIKSEKADLKVSKAKDEVKQLTDQKNKLTDQKNKLIEEISQLEKKNKSLGEMFNDQLLDSQRKDYSKFKGIEGELNIKPRENILKGSTIGISGRVRYPFDCEYYWILFVESENVWPKIPIKNTGLQDQLIDYKVAVPQEFSQGELLVTCVSNKIHQQFTKWIEGGYDSPLRKPTRLDVVLRTNLSTIKGGSQ